MLAVQKKFRKPHLLREFKVNGSPNTTLSISTCYISLHSNTVMPAKHQFLAISEVNHDIRRKHDCLVITTHTIHGFLVAHLWIILEFMSLQRDTRDSRMVPLQPCQKTQICIKIWNEWHEMKPKEEMVYLQLAVHEFIHWLACIGYLNLRDILHYTRLKTKWIVF